MSGKCCGNCFYYVNGACRKLPPKIIHFRVSKQNRLDQVDSAWPPVNGDGWCGEHNLSLIKEEEFAKSDVSK